MSLATGMHLEMATGYGPKGHKTISKKQCGEKFETLKHLEICFLFFAIFFSIFMLHLLTVVLLKICKSVYEVIINIMTLILKNYQGLHDYQVWPKRLKNSGYYIQKKFTI